MSNEKGEEYIPLTNQINMGKSQTANGATKLRLHRFRKGNRAEYESLGKFKRNKSPKILITRAFSEESESTADRSIVPPKTSSSVTTLIIDSTWKSVSRESIALNKSNPLFNYYTDESGSDESTDDFRQGFGTR